MAERTKGVGHGVLYLDKNLQQLLPKMHYIFWIIGNIKKCILSFIFEGILYSDIWCFFLLMALFLSWNSPARFKILSGRRTVSSAFWEDLLVEWSGRWKMPNRHDRKHRVLPFQIVVLSTVSRVFRRLRGRAKKQSHLRKNKNSWKLNMLYKIQSFYVKVVLKTWISASEARFLRF